METFYVIISFILFFISLKLLFGTRQRKLNLPPSPPWSLPIIGHLRLLKLPLHRTFLSLSKSLNTSVFSLKLVTRLVVVVSSYPAVVECSTVNDVVLSNRPRFIASDHIAYNSSTMVAAPYGDSWRNLRRIANIEIFSTHRLNSFLSIRQDEIRRLILYLSRKSKQEFVKVEMLRSMFLDMTLNNILRMIAGKRFYGYGTEESNEAKNVKEVIEGVNNIGGPGIAADYFPILRYVTSYENKVKKLARRSDALLESMVNEKRAEKVKGNTMIEHLLSLQETQPDYYTDVIIKGIVLNMVVAGTDTSAGTLEWALASLLNHPEVLQKAKIEIDDQIGCDRLMEEPDLVKLPYLQNIVNEALRLYPVTPMLLPRLASDDCTIQGYDIPRGTTVLVNAWAINRDPELWEEPDKFKPERFEKEREYKIKKVMSFGNGRRACAGEGLAHRLVTLALGSLIQCFEWERVNGEDVDMRESEGGTIMYKATPLEAMCRARPIVCKIVDD